MPESVPVPVELPDDEGLRMVLSDLGVDPAALLGHGGEAWVYALDRDRVVRVLHEFPGPDAISGRQAFVDELAKGGGPYLLPELLEVGSVGDRHYTVEARLPGNPVHVELENLDRAGRNRLIEAHLTAAASLGELPLEPRGWFGDLLADPPVRAATWRAYLTAKAQDGLERAPGFDKVDPAELAGALPDTSVGAFVHLDAFAGNMLATGSTIMAVIDIGTSSVCGDRRLDPLSAAVYFCAPEITPVANEADRSVVRSWLHNAGLEDWYEPARCWLAAFWAWATDDVKLHQWCRSVLVD